MAGKTVLAIGIDPVFADFSDRPQLSAELVRSCIDAELQRLRDQGFVVVPCLTDLGETAEHAVTAALNSENFDCVVIGAGLREPPVRLHLFETIINLIHRLAPNASICFNRNPADAAEVVARRVQP
jgi:hypothetical protein